ncbi:hypothetical protein HMPREF3291_17090 [Bacillus sp. HMSC76G11]|nr:hypothetical protein HMPREF3291_17090 [Bacillus sp. HMSC76G11]
MIRTYQPVAAANLETDWQALLFKPLSERSGFVNTPSEIKIPQIAIRMLGTPLVEDEYFQTLYDLVHNDELEIHFISENLDKTIPQEKFQAIQNLLILHGKEKLSVNRFVAFMDRDQLLPMLGNPELNRHLRACVIKVLTPFFENRKDETGDFRRVIVDLVKWTWNHLYKELEKTANQDDRIPAFFWYGNATPSEQHFLKFLILFGCDVIVAHPEGTDILADADPDEAISKIIRYPGTHQLTAFPKTRPERTSTIAYKASKEIDQVLHSDDSMLYKPWQFRNYSPNAITLKTTYDELFILIKERAFLRPNFEVRNNTVNIPAIFSKIFGMTKNRRAYWSKIQDLTDYEYAEVIKQFPFTWEAKGNPHFHYQNALGEKQELQADKMMNSHWWRYSNLPTGLQKGIAEAISRYCAHPKLKKQDQESLYDLQLYLFNQAMNIPNSMIKLMQNFDYSQYVPRIVLYNNENNGFMTRADAAILLLMNEFGLDIVLYNPPGHNDIENFVDERYFDSHWLDEMSFGEEFQEPSRLKKFIRKMF